MGATAIKPKKIKQISFIGESSPRIPSILSNDIVLKSLVISTITRLTIDKNNTSLISVCHFFTHFGNFFKLYSFYPNNVCRTGMTITNKTVLRVTTLVENSTSPFP